MAKKSTKRSPVRDGDSSASAKQSPPAEERFGEELSFLVALDQAERAAAGAERASVVGARPPGWQLSPRQVVTFICGSQGEKLKLPSGAKVAKGSPRSLEISEKFIGPRALVERCVVTLAGERGLLLVGEPGTAKSMLSELLAAAISGTSALTVQGTAGASEEHLRYAWNYALLLAQGPTEEALTPSPIMIAMRHGRIGRIEEVTRCLPEVQDALISLLSERRIAVPELQGEQSTVYAAAGFNLIATANLRDKGVSEMSAALKRRFNFEVVGPIAEFQREVDLVKRQAVARLAESGLELTVDDAVLEMLVTAFRDLREGRTDEGWTVEKPSTVMSTAEAVAVAASIGRQAAYFPSQRDPLSLIPSHLLGVVLKDDAKDRSRLLAYWDSAVKRRSDDGARAWKRLLELRGDLQDEV